MTFTQVPIVGSYATADGDAADGSLTFTPTASMRNGSVTSGETITVILVDGAVPDGVTLSATDDEGTSPAGVTYWVTENVGGPVVGYYLPVSAEDEEIDLGTVDRAAVAPEVLLYAPLGADGLVPASYLPAASGGSGGAVDSVAGRTGAVVLTKSDVGLGSVDNTADTAKPVSTAQATALAAKADASALTAETARATTAEGVLTSAVALKAPLASPAFTGTPTGITKSHVGLGNVDNTADTAKPVSTAQQTALDGKADTSHVHSGADITSGTVPVGQLPTGTSGSTVALGNHTHAYAATSHTHAESDVTSLVSDLAGKASTSALSTHIADTANPHGVTKSQVGLGSVDNTADTAKPISTATQTALDGKAATTVTDALSTRLAAVELPEYATAAQTAAVTASGMLSKLIRFNTTSGAINQTLPAATAGAVFAIGWESGANTLTYTAAGSDVIGGGSTTSATVSVLGEVVAMHCTTTGRWRVLHGFKPTSGLDTRYAALSHTHAATDLTSGTVATARLGSGSASSSTFLRGDQTWATPAGASGAPYGQPARSGGYVAALGPTSSGAITGTLRAAPIYLSTAGTADRIGIEITTLQAASTVSLAIYADDSATGLPAALILDAGVIDSSSTGFKEITISQALSAGKYWLGLRTASGTSPSTRSVTATYTATYVTAQSDTLNAFAGVSGGSSVPSTFSVTGVASTVGRVYLRFA